MIGPEKGLTSESDSVTISKKKKFVEHHRSNAGKDNSELEVVDLVKEFLGPLGKITYQTSLVCKK